ncbi:GPP34 family phosphoprotein [Streptomyces sp. NPDC008313]|uniref:GPP34 family phosphoprotein n=1 Tax=Streptomyces sp. NPDC008313 TaxID=3364826 RepID=UPI0036EF3C10
MTTPRDLFIVSLDVASGSPVEQGDLSLALAGAEVIDLLGAGALTLDGDHLVPGDHWTQDDPLLDAAAGALVRETARETVEDWLWRRGLGLYSAYLAVMEADGQVRRERGRRLAARAARTSAADSPARRRAADRWSSGDPVLTLLAAAVGIGRPDGEGGELPDVTDDTIATVLAAVNDAVQELDGVRRRRAIEQAAFDNIWRGQ